MNIWVRMGSEEELTRGNLGRPSCVWGNSIRMYLKEIGVNMRNWIDSANDRDYWRALVIKVLNLWIP